MLSRQPGIHNNRQKLDFGGVVSSPHSPPSRNSDESKTIIIFGSGNLFLEFGGIDVDRNDLGEAQLIEKRSLKATMRWLRLS